MVLEVGVGGGVVVQVVAGGGVGECIGGGGGGEWGGGMHVFWEGMVEGEGAGGGEGVPPDSLAPHRYIARTPPSLPPSTHRLSCLVDFLFYTYSGERR